MATTVSEFAPSSDATSSVRAFGIFYEQQQWFKPLFAKLEERGIPFARIDATQHHFDLSETSTDGSAFGLFFNRMSPSAYHRGNGNGIFYTLYLLEHLERLGTRVINGSKAFRYETSKALQLSLLNALHLPYPRARVINHASQAAIASEGLRFPVVVKPNIGGSGKGVTRFDSRERLEEAVRDGAIDLGLDSTALVQEFIAAQGNHIVRVEVVGGKYLYAIKVHLTGETFDLCPADICRTPDDVALTPNSACVVEAHKAGLRIEAYTPPAEVIANVERIMQTAGIDVGGVEYITDARDGSLLYYDINALSNFVSDGPTLLGFDPFDRLVDFLLKEAR